MTSQQTAQSFSYNTPKLTSSKKCVVETLTDSKQVCDKPCILLDIGASFVSEFEDHPPDSVDDIDNFWSNENRSIDEDIDTYAECIVPDDTFTGFLVFDLGEPLYTTKFYFAVTVAGIGLVKMQVDYWNGTEWINLFWGAFIPNIARLWQSITPVIMPLIRIRFIKDGPGLKTFQVREFGVTGGGLFDFRLHDGFGSDYEMKHKITLSHTGNYFVCFDKPLYFDKGLYFYNEAYEGNVCLHYLVLKDRAWFTPPTLQPPKRSIPGLRLCIRLFALLRGWFTK